MLIKMGKKVGKILDEVLRLAGDTGHFLMIKEMGVNWQQKS